MRKIQKIINRDIISNLSKLGHLDMFAIVDCGTPIPINVKTIDLSTIMGHPKFIDIYEMIINETHIQNIRMAKEIINENKNIYSQIQKINKKNDIKLVINELNYNHQNLKSDLAKCKWIIRTGEASPYANIILVSGIIF